MKKLLALLLSLYAGDALAQTKFTMPPPAGVTVMGLQVVTTCGAASGLIAGNTAFAAMDTTGTLCTAGGGGGGGAVTIANGADVAEGSTTDAPCVSGSTTPCTVESRLAHIENLAAAAIPAGTAIIGKVGIDQTTPGTTNLVALTAETTKVIGTVNQGTSPWVVSGTVTAGGVAQASTTSGQTGGLVQGAVTTSAPSYTTAQTDPLSLTTAGDLRTVFSNTTIAATNAGTFAVQNGPATTGGLSSFFVQPAASDNHTVIKNGAGQVYYVLAMNNSATVNYLRFYDAGTGFNGCNSATNLISQIQIPASTSVGGVSIPLAYGLTFATGISICVTSAYATNDTTNATASAMSVTVGYK